MIRKNVDSHVYYDSNITCTTTIIMPCNDNIIAYLHERARSGIKILCRLQTSGRR